MKELSSIFCRVLPGVVLNSFRRSLQIREWHPVETDKDRLKEVGVPGRVFISSGALCHRRPASKIKRILTTAHDEILRPTALFQVQGFVTAQVRRGPGSSKSGKNRLHPTGMVIHLPRIASSEDGWASTTSKEGHRTKLETGRVSRSWCRFMSGGSYGHGPFRQAETVVVGTSDVLRHTSCDVRGRA